MTYQYNTTTYTRTGDLLFDFVIQTADGFGRPIANYSSDFGKGNISQEVFETRLTNGTLNLTAISGSYNTYLFNTFITLPSGPLTFADIPATSSVTGNIGITYPNPYGGTGYFGTVTKLVRVGTVASFVAPFATLLPEPATWAMMIAGFGLIGAGLRRRKVTPAFVAA